MICQKKVRNDDSCDSFKIKGTLFYAFNVGNMALGVPDTTEEDLTVNS